LSIGGVQLSLGMTKSSALSAFVKQYDVTDVPGSSGLTFSIIKTKGSPSSKPRLVGTIIVRNDRVVEITPNNRPTSLAKSAIDLSEAYYWAIHEQTEGTTTHCTVQTDQIENESVNWNRIKILCGNRRVYLEVFLKSPTGAFTGITESLSLLPE
jgi:hypothetical protein